MQNFFDVGIKKYFLFHSKRRLIEIPYEMIKFDFRVKDIVVRFILTEHFKSSSPMYHMIIRTEVCLRAMNDWVAVFTRH